jgi:integrase/recombinase XerD
MAHKVVLLMRIHLEDGQRVYAAPASTRGKLKPGIALVNGKAEVHEEGVYVLRYRENGRLVYIQVGKDPSAAQVAQIRQELVLQTEAAGLTVVRSEPKPAQMPAKEKRKLSDCITDYLTEIEAQRTKKTLAAYRVALTLFTQAIRKTYIEDVTREDVLEFVLFLRKRGLAPRTVRNRVDFFQFLLHHCKLPSLLQGKDLPKYTEKEARAYNALELGKMFGHATVDESDFLHFLFGTGVREQEAQYACWTDVDLETGTYRVTEHLDLGFTPKDKEERTVLLSTLLIELLRQRRKRYPGTRLIFPSKRGKPNGHMLRIIKRLALRSGINCGHCMTKKGKSCAKFPVCRDMILHKWRKTYATTLHQNGLSARTIMRLLGHSDLHTTLRYLASQDDGATREAVNRSFNGFAVAEVA